MNSQQIAELGYLLKAARRAMVWAVREGYYLQGEDAEGKVFQDLALALSPYSNEERKGLIIND